MTKQPEPVTPEEQPKRVSKPKAKPVRVHKGRDA